MIYKYSICERLISKFTYLERNYYTIFFWEFVGEYLSPENWYDQILV